MVTNPECIITYKLELVCSHMPDDAIAVEYDSVHIVGEGSSVTDIDKHPVADRSLHRHRITELVNHLVLVVIDGVKELVTHSTCFIEVFAQWLVLALAVSSPLQNPAIGLIQADVPIRIGATHNALGQ